MCIRDRYKTAHDFGAPATLEGYADFETEYLKLKNSELLQYEDKVDAAREAAEEEFSCLLYTSRCV